MKKQLISLALALAMLLPMAGCGSTVSAETTAAATEETTVETTVETTAAETQAEIYEVPKNFTDGYVYGDYETYSDTTKAESMKGNLVWIDGAITALGTIESDDSYLGTILVSDESGNTWVVFVGVADSAAEEQNYEYNYAENGVCVKGVYIGTNDKGVPAMAAHYAFFVGSGENQACMPNYTYKAETAEETQPTETKPAETNPAATQPAATEPAATQSSSVTPSFKATMDSYEEFFDEYVEFYNEYKENPTNLGLLAKYAEFMTKYTETMEKLDSIDTSNLSDADMAYYLEVSGRIMQKLSGML